MVELTTAMGSQRQALAAVGLSRSTWHYRTKPRPRVIDPVPQHQREYRSRITPFQRTQIETRIQTAWQAGNSIDHAFASAWDEGLMFASRRSWWRIGAQIVDQSARPVAPTRRRAHTPREAPVLRAFGPGEVWSWDITDLRSPWRGRSFKAYSIIDIYSRKLVGWRVEQRESDHLAVDMFATAIATHSAPVFVHADSGPAMRSSLLADFLLDNAITQTHNRPHVSNDNPFSESEFRTMKYRPNYPGTFPTLDAARDFLANYVTWYNQHHRHTGIGLFTPDEVHNGTWRHRWHARNDTLERYYATHPERFHAPPTTPAPANLVSINHTPQRLQAA